jgi:hypothetical protein
VLDDDDNDGGGPSQEVSAAAMSLWAIVKRELNEQEEKRAADAAAGGLPENRRVWNPFIYRVRWDLILRREHSEDDHVLFVALPRANVGGGGLNELHNVALAYIHLVSKEVADGHMVLRKKMMVLSE